MQENFGPSKTFAPEDCGQGTAPHLHKQGSSSENGKANRNRTLRHRSSLTAKSLQSSLTLWNSWAVARQSPLFMGFSRQEYYSWLPYPPLGDLPDPGIEPASLMSPASAGGFFTTSATSEAHIIDMHHCVS